MTTARESTLKDGCSCGGDVRVEVFDSVAQDRRAMLRLFCLRGRGHVFRPATEARLADLVEARVDLNIKVERL